MGWLLRLDPGLKAHCRSWCGAPSTPWSGQASVQQTRSSARRVCSACTANRKATADTGTLRVTLHSDQRPALLGGVDQRGTGQNTAQMYEDPREFFLAIDASGVTWKVSLEEGLCTLAPNPQSD